MGNGFKHYKPKISKFVQRRNKRNWFLKLIQNQMGIEQERQRETEKEAIVKIN